MPYQKRYPIKKNTLSKNLTKNLKKVPYQESKQNTLSKNHIKNLKKGALSRKLIKDQKSV